MNASHEHALHDMPRVCKENFISLNLKLMLAPLRQVRVTSFTTRASKLNVQHQHDPIIPYRSKLGTHPCRL
jgi:hypothetical protein